MGEHDDRTLWCGNLAPETTEEIVYELFLQAGPIERVNIPKDREGKQRSYAFITFKHGVSVLYARDMLGDIKLYGRALRLQSRSSNNSETTSQEDPKFPKSNLNSCPPKPHYLVQELGNERGENGSTNNNGNCGGRVRGGGGGGGFRDDSFNKSHFREERVGYDRQQQQQQHHHQHHNGYHSPNSFQSPSSQWQNALPRNFTIDKNAIFDPVIDQKLNERYRQIQQENQLMMQPYSIIQTPTNQGRIQPSFWPRSNNPWWN